MAARDHSLDFHFNVTHAPDFVKDVLGDARAEFNKQLDSLPDGLAPMLHSIFATLMGGFFTYDSVAWHDRAFEFGYIPPTEEAPHQVSPFYLPVGASVPPGPPKFTAPNLDKADHIVVLIMENRSFDHVLGYLSLTGGRKPDQLDGLTQQIIASFPEGGRPFAYKNNVFPFDPGHDFEDVAMQIGGDLGGHGPMRGFGLNFLTKYPFLAFDANNVNRKKQDDPRWYELRKPFGPDAVMGYHTADLLPTYAYLARQYMVCDRWFCSHPGPTLPNRFFSLCGRLASDDSGEPLRNNSISTMKLVRHPTVFDALTERNVSWKMYESPPDVSMLRMFARYAFDDTNIRPINEFFAAAQAGMLPSVSFIDPNFHVSQQTNDDHPPTDMGNGQALVKRVVDAIKSNAGAWQKTVLIITYDEHGGLYDHVLPGVADRYRQPGRANIDVGYGVRVPAFIVSPWVPVGSCSHTVFDHTSILKTIANRFCASDPFTLSDRMAYANDVLPLLSLKMPQIELGGVSTGAVAHAVSLEDVHVLATATFSGGAGAAVALAPFTWNARLATDPLPRASIMLNAKTDWHQYMTRLSLMTKGA